jgi:UPF0176 protein
MRARLALHVSAVTVELREIVLRDKPVELLRANPLATVPVLILPDGQVLAQSLDVMRWALQQNDPQGWLTPEQTGCAATVARWLQANDGPFKGWLDAYKYPQRHPAKPQAAWREQALVEHLLPMAQQLASTGYLVADRPTLADMALMPFIRQFAAVDADWWAHCAPAPLRRWLKDLLADQALYAVMRKVAVWHSGSDPIYFP